MAHEGEPLPTGGGNPLREGLLTPRQAGRVGTFRHIINVARIQEQLIAEHGPRVYGHLGPDGRVDDVYMQIDQPFISRWNRVAGQIYERELAQNPQTKQTASEIMAENKANDHTLTPSQLRDIYNRSD